ncbi:uncharacterized protein isoform X2 [Rhodnius prolixus]|uniref:Putative serpin length n=1 Tax=Rhodnius prolixus TaxID=13249 RepID=R4FLK8_RHOPR
MVQRSATSVFILTTLVVIITARSWRQTGGENFFGEGTTDLTVSILKSQIDNNTNLVFSPLGYATILTILSEGARGNTRNQLVKALHLPEDTYAVRSTYKSVLSDMQERNVLNKPEFKNWFYVYKNYSVEESYKKTLSDNYLTVVKEIERDYYYSSSNSENNKEEETENYVTENSCDKLPTETTENNKESNEPEAAGEETGLETSTKEEEDENVDITGEDKGKEHKKKTFKVGNKKTETVMEEVIARALREEVRVEKEMLSALSANRLSSVNQTDSEANSEEKSDSRMIIFNALYFRGNWTIPFFSKAEKKGIFYKSENEKKQVQVIHSEGEFEYGLIPDLDAIAIELPYQGGRYSLLLLVPNSRSGLKKLTANLKKDSLKDIKKYLSKNTVEVCIPKFKFYSITRPKNALTQNGVTDLFNDAADLSGITGSKGLYLNDLVQLVTLEVDENSGSYNFLTTTDAAETRSAAVKFTADQPFLFFLRDRIDNFIVVAGKLQDPADVNHF